MRLLIAATLALALTACKPVPSNSSGDLPPEQVWEFACYTEGKLTERHVGVKNYYHTGGVFRIYYVDTKEFKDYTPRLGESCGLEVVR